MNKEKKQKRQRRSINDEITDTEGRDLHESVVISVSMTRGLYLHALRAVRDGDYPAISTYLSDLVRRDKHACNKSASASACCVSP